MQDTANKTKTNSITSIERLVNQKISLYNELLKLITSQCKSLNVIERKEKQNTIDLVCGNKEENELIKLCLKKLITLIEFDDELSILFQNCSIQNDLQKKKFLSEIVHLARESIMKTIKSSDKQSQISSLVKESSCEEAEEKSQKKKTFSLFEMLDSNSTKMNFSTFTSSDDIITAFLPSNDFQTALTLIQKIQDLNDVYSSWNELNSLVLRPSLLLHTAKACRKSIDIVKSYYQEHLILFQKLGIDYEARNMKIDLFMNVLTSILQQSHSFGFYTSSPFSKIQYLSSLYFIQINTLYELLSNFDLKSQGNAEYVDKVMISLFYMLRAMIQFPPLSTITQKLQDTCVLLPIHVFALKDPLAIWFSTLANKINPFQLLEYLKFSGLLYDLFHFCISLKFQTTKSCKTQQDIPFHWHELSEDDLFSKDQINISKKDLDYNLFIHSLSMVKTLLVRCKNIFPWDHVMMKINQESFLISFHELPTQEYILKELKKDHLHYGIVRCFHSKNEYFLQSLYDSLPSNNEEAVKLLVKPFSIWLKFQTRQAFVAKLQNEDIFQICFEAYNAILQLNEPDSYVLVLNSLLQDFLTPLFRQKHQLDIVYKLLHILRSSLSVSINSQLLQSEHDLRQSSEDFLKGVVSYYEELLDDGGLVDAYSTVLSNEQLFLVWSFLLSLLSACYESQDFKVSLSFDAILEEFRKFIQLSRFEVEGGLLLDMMKTSFH